MTSSSLHPLDNPIWHSLTSAHKHLAKGDSHARRYPALISPLAAVESGVIQTEKTVTPYDSLEEIIEEGESVFLFLDKKPDSTDPNWKIKFTAPILQMVCQHFIPPVLKTNAPSIELLDDTFIPEMLALTQLTEPGPFKEQTNRMGDYYGILQNGRLAAMSGVRLHLQDYTEVSAVCTHPDFQGKGFAKLLVAKVSQDILANGKTPFLHVKADNAGAIYVYEQLGFKPRRYIHFAILEHAASNVLSSY
ncbi:MAG: GNAT family N-acetyltransferase [Vampirovibrionales bacterium]|nr:GNAT family N-acetyltransferase [Vampirovibrionales bacterium]